MYKQQSKENHRKLYEFLNDGINYELSQNDPKLEKKSMKPPKCFYLLWRKSKNLAKWNVLSKKNDIIVFILEGVNFLTV